MPSRVLLLRAPKPPPMETVRIYFQPSPMRPLLNVGNSPGFAEENEGASVRQLPRLAIMRDALNDIDGFRAQQKL